MPKGQAAGVAIRLTAGILAVAVTLLSPPPPMIAKPQPPVPVEPSDAAVMSMRFAPEPRVTVTRASRSQARSHAAITSGAPASRASILACIRSFEGWYTANTGNGYYGAYQFLRSTWDGVAKRWAPRLVGVRPDLAAPRDQDYLAWKLYQDRGLRPWGDAARSNC